MTMGWKRSARSTKPATPWMILSLVALAAPAGAQTPADDFADFRIPEHRSRRGSVSLQGNFSRTTFNAFSRARSEDGSAAVQGMVRGFLDSEPTQQSWVISTGFSGRRDWRRNVDEGSGSRNEVESSTRQTSESWLLFGEHRRYPGARPLALGATAQVSGAYAQQWLRDLQSQASPPVVDVTHRATDADNYRYDASMSLEAGVGRVRDATGIYDAYVLEERLQATGALTRPLSRAARQKIAALHYARPEYSAATERPDKFFWRDVERVLREDGALREGGLDAYDVLRVIESRFPANVTRMRGWFAGLVAVAQHTSLISRFEAHNVYQAYVGGVLASTSESRGSSRLETSDDQILPGLQAEGHRPLGVRTQLDGTAQLLVPVLHVDGGLQGNLAGGASWFVQERWLASVNGFYDRRYQTGDPGRPSLHYWRADYGVTLTYFLQDRVTANLRLVETQARTAGVPAYFRVGQASLGLGYSFWRGFDAPGLTDPVRPLSTR